MKIRSGLLTAAAIALLLNACGGKEEAAPATESTARPAEELAPAEPAPAPATEHPAMPEAATPAAPGPGAAPAATTSGPAADPAEAAEPPSGKFDRSPRSYFDETRSVFTQVSRYLSEGRIMEDFIEARGFPDKREKEVTLEELLEDTPSRNQEFLDLMKDYFRYEDL